MLRGKHQVLIRPGFQVSICFLAVVMKVKSLGKSLGPSQVGSTVSHDLSQHVYVLASFRSSSQVPIELLLIPSPYSCLSHFPFWTVRQDRSVLATAAPLAWAWAQNLNRGGQISEQL